MDYEHTIWRGSPFENGKPHQRLRKAIARREGVSTIHLRG